jgi:hypothetical protein
MIVFCKKISASMPVWHSWSKVFLRPDQKGQYLIHQFSDLATGSGGISDNTLGGFGDNLPPNPPNFKGGFRNKKYIFKYSKFVKWSFPLSVNKERG